MRRFRFLGRALDSPKKQERAAHEFAELVGSVVNATISHAPITFVEVAGETPAWFIAHLGSNKVPAPLPLVNEHYFFLYQLLGLRRKEHDLLPAGVDSSGREFSSFR